MIRSTALVALVCAGCGRPPAASPTASPPAPAADALARGVAFLLSQQSPDGAWRSDVYGTFKDGHALTPLVVAALQAADAAPDGRRKGAAFLAAMARPDGAVDEGDGGLDYPAYTAALSVVALSHPENAARRSARDVWLKYLLDRQLTATLGWSPDDKAYGGWGYCRTVPRKPEPGRLAPPLVESNLSATVFALDALRAAGVADPKPYEAAAVFVRRRQNPDGGFHFVYDDPVRNKAGGLPGLFHSYGSATADGLRALRYCGRPADAATKWLAAHARPDTHPGTYVAPHERNREAVYFYYAASLAKAGFGSPALAAELSRRQRPDGSWANPVELVRENDPVVATANAVAALAACRPATK